MKTTAKILEDVSITPNKLKPPNSPIGAKTWCRGKADSSGDHADASTIRIGVQSIATDARTAKNASRNVRSARGGQEDKPHLIGSKPKRLSAPKDENVLSSTGMTRTHRKMRRSKPWPRETERSPFGELVPKCWAEARTLRRVLKVRKMAIGMVNETETSPALSAMMTSIRNESKQCGWLQIVNKCATLQDRKKTAYLCRLASS